MGKITYEEFSTAINYLRSPDKEIQYLGIIMFNSYNIIFRKLYSYFTVDGNGWIFTITPTEILMGDSYSCVDLSMEDLYRCITENWDD